MKDVPVPIRIAPGSETRPSFRTEFACTLVAVRNAVNEVRQFLASEGLTETELDAWELAIVEGANNFSNGLPRLYFKISIESK